MFSGNLKSLSSFRIFKNTNLFHLGDIPILLSKQYFYNKMSIIYLINSIDEIFFDYT